MNKIIVALIGIVVVLAGALYFLPELKNTPNPDGVACTAEAKMCPDGSGVGRVGPNCEFAECPVVGIGELPDGVPFAQEGEHCGGFIKDAPVCTKGYHCLLNVSRPDTGGICLADPVTGGGNGIAPYTSGIRGTIMVGPTCPVMQNPPDPKCADKPLETNVSIYRASDTTRSIVTTTSAKDGTFEASLPPGDYVVMSGPYGVPMPSCTDATATVGPNSYTNITVSCDSGIR